MCMKVIKLQISEQKMLFKTDPINQARIKYHKRTPEENFRAILETGLNQAPADISFQIENDKLSTEIQ